MTKESATDDVAPKPISVLNQGVDDDEETHSDFWGHFFAQARFLGIKLNDAEIRSAEEGGDDEAASDVVPTLFALKHSIGGFASGPFRKVSGGRRTKPPVTDLSNDGIYLVDTGDEIHVWIGRNSSRELAKNIFPFTMLYLRRGERPPILPLHIYRAGHEPDEFHELFSKPREPNRATLWLRAVPSLRQFYRDHIVEIFDPRIKDKSVDESKENLGKNRVALDPNMTSNDGAFDGNV